VYYRIATGITRILLVTALLGACTQTAPKPEPTMAQSESLWPEPVGVRQLAREGGGDRGLDAGLVIFDPGIPEDASTHSELELFPQIRKAEALYIPVMLADVLQQTNGWGVVRVYPQATLGVELIITGRILHSDGQRLALKIRAVDATGRQWLDRVYVDETQQDDFPVVAGEEPYADIYRAIANDLLQQQRQMSARELQEIRQLALIRYAEGLAPAAFSGYLSGDEATGLQLQRLPAEDDPMLARVHRIRNQEHLFIDHVDEQYVQLRDDMAGTYHLWRQYDREQAIFRTEYEQRVLQRGSQGRPGSYFAMQSAYDAYKWRKIQEQDLDELAGGFNNETLPTVMEANGRVFKLNGSLQNQYDQWRGILSQIFRLETGL
jgi:hypothetical protein